MSESFNRWEFIEEWLPDYSSNEDVAYSNDLDCYIHGETENSQYYKLKEKFPDIQDAIVEQEYVDSILFAKAYASYEIFKEHELECKRKEAEQNRPIFVVNVRLVYEKVMGIRADNAKEAEEIAKRLVDESGISLQDHGFDLDTLKIEALS